MADYTDDQKDTIRRAAFGAMGLVSRADPGFFASFSESLAGAKALAAAPPQIAELLQGGLLVPTAKSAEEFEQQTLQRLGEAMQLTAANPTDQAALRDVILAACQHVAEASKGVSADEQAMIDKVRAAVGGGANALGGEPVAEEQAPRRAADDQSGAAPSGGGSW